MNKIIASFFLCAILFSGCKKEDKNMRREGDLYIVNTTEIGKDIIGFKDAVPCVVTIKSDGSIQSVQICDNNQETPKFVERVKENLLPKMEGANAETIKNIDGITGATFTSNAVLRNADVALKYFETNK